MSVLSMFDSQCGFPVLIFTVFTPAYGNVLVMHITRCDYQQHSIEMKTEEEGGRRWEDERQKMGEPPHTKLRGMDLTHRFSEIPGGSWRFLEVPEGSHTHLMQSSSKKNDFMKKRRRNEKLYSIFANNSAFYVSCFSTLPSGIQRRLFIFIF